MQLTNLCHRLGFMVILQNPTYHEYTPTIDNLGTGDLDSLKPHPKRMDKR